MPGTLSLLSTTRLPRYRRGISSTPCTRLAASPRGLSPVPLPYSRPRQRADYASEIKYAFTKSLMREVKSPGSPSTCMT